MPKRLGVTMKTLTKVILVQWFRLQAVEIPIVGSTAFIGDNGAGKSALLDAIQTVLTGANKRFMVLNRGSNEQSSRKLWEYVLGVMSDPKKPELATKIKPREKANCYLALNFHDTETGETTCVGLGIYASMADMDENVEGRFICPGLVGHKDLFLEQHESDKMTVLPWARVKERLAKACPSTRFHHEAGKFTQDLYGCLSENPGSPNKDKTVLKALQAAFRLEKISDPTDFIRRYMLDRDDLQIKELQSALKNYRDMAEKADSVSRRVDELNRLEVCCEKVEHGRSQQVMAEYVSLCAQSEEIEEHADPLREALADLEESREQMTNQKTDHDLHLATLHGKLGEKRAEQKNSDIQNQRDRLKLEIEQNQQKENDVKATITDIRQLLQRFDKLKNVPAPDSLNKAIAGLVNSLPNDDMVSATIWPTEPDKIDGSLSMLRDALEQGLPVLNSRYDGLCAEMNGLDTRLKSLVEVLKQLQHGKAPLQANTRNLIQFFKKHGIEAKPLCDLVDVADEAWRNTVESILGPRREALIVIPEQARKAVNLYRHEGRIECPGCHIVTTTQTERWKDNKQNGSLADKLTVDDVHARAFINRRLGNIICVETEKDLLHYDRAATADGMLNSGGSVSEMKQIPPILGRGSREVLQAAYQRELNELSKKQKDVTQEKEHLGAFKILLEDYKRRFAGDTVFSAVMLVEKRENLNVIIQGLQNRLNALAMDTREENLNKEIVNIEAEIGVYNDKIKELAEKLRLAEKEYTQKEDKLKELEKQKDLLRELLKVKRSEPLLDPPLAADTLNRWRDQYDGNFSAMISRANEVIKSAKNAIEHNDKQIVRDYTEYYLKYSIEEGDESPPEGFEAYAITIRRKKKHLVETTLADYRDKAVRALHEAEDTFRSKFVGRLNDKLNEVRGSISQLNKTLEKHPFHGEIYKFRSSSNPEFKHIIDFAKACNSPVSREVGGLFDPAVDPDNPHRKALDDITTALQDPKAAERLQDYRNFLVFEVEMCDTEGTPTADLEHRIQKGSGGENQTPFYVAIGASLAAAYRLKEEYGKYHGGMSVAVFDEAFSKLSVATCHSCIEFLKNIQLQLIVAAPDEKYATMAEVMDTIVWVTRDGGTVETEVISIKPAMRALLRSDNPYRQASGTAEFLHEPV
jgi:uncharacterized protein YPO0396